MIIHKKEALPTGIGSVTVGDNEVKIYPNPFRNILNISTESPYQKVEIYDNAGRLVHHETVQQTSKLDLTHLNPGSYHLMLIDQHGGSTHQKILKK